ncbi:MAG: T9SS type A sorting domain-containing protein [Planctomycetota bacterium]
MWGEVAVLRDAEQGQGSHEVKWDGSDSADRDLVAGVYFLRLEAGDETQTSKVMLLR